MDGHLANYIADQLAARLRSEEGIAACSRSLIARAPDAIEKAISHLRVAANASRVYIFESISDPFQGPYMRQVCESCAPGIDPQIANPRLQHIPFSSDNDPLLSAISQGKVFWRTIEQIPETLRGLLESQDVRSMLCIPILVSGALYGFIGFDDTKTPRQWSPEDIRLLTTAAEMIGDYIFRERATAELAAGKAKMDSIFRTSPVAIGIVVGRCMMEVNDRMCSMMGYSKDELLGNDSRMLYPTQAEYEGVGRDLEQALRQVEAVTRPARMVRKDGVLLHVLLSFSSIVRDNPSAGMIFTILDNTEQVRADEERRQMEAQVRHAQNLESLGVLAGGIAHDFNNLLMVILGNVELVLSATPRNGGMRGSLEEIDAAGHHAAELTRQLLAYAGRESLRAQSMDISTVIRETAPEFEITIGKRAAVDYGIEEGLPPITIDASKIRQAIMSIVINALESLGEGTGRITICTGSELLDKEQLARCVLGNAVKPGRFTFFEVADTGCGMRPETIVKIFDPFFSTKFAGRGLGLAAVHGIVKAHHGCIRVASTVGQGTSFRVFLPIARDG